MGGVYLTHHHEPAEVRLKRSRRAIRICRFPSPLGDFDPQSVAKSAGKGVAKRTETFRLMGNKLDDDSLATTARFNGRYALNLLPGNPAPTKVAPDANFFGKDFEFPAPDA